MFTIAIVLKYTATGWIRPLFAPGPNPGPQAGARAYFVLSLVFGLESRVCRRRIRTGTNLSGNQVSCQGLDHSVFETLERFVGKIRISPHGQLSEDPPPNRKTVVLKFPNTRGRKRESKNLLLQLQMETLCVS